MFSGCLKLYALDLSSFDASSQPTLSSMLSNCPELSKLTLSAGLNLSGSSLRDAWWKDSSGIGYSTTQEMLSANAARESGVEVYTASNWTRSGTCEWKIDNEGLLSIRPLGGFGTGSLADWGTEQDSSPWYSVARNIKSVKLENGVFAQTCHGMFSGCSNMTFCDLSGMDASSVTDMANMFSGCYALSSVDLSSFDTSNVQDMSDMFFTCWSLSSLDLSSFNTSKVTNMSRMFEGDYSIGKIYASRSFTTNAATSSNGMFDHCTSLVGGAGTAYDSSFVDTTRARIDGGANAPGYFTGKHEKLDGDINGNGVLSVVDAQIAYDIATTGLYKDRQDYADMRARADVTWDNEVDATDAFAIQYAALRGW